MKTTPVLIQLELRTDRRRTPDRRLSRIGGRRATDMRRWATNADLFAASTGVLLPWPGPGRHQTNLMNITN